jgi:parallel beta-helix repeat protein
MSNTNFSSHRTGILKSLATSLAICAAFVALPSTSALADSSSPACNLYASSNGSDSNSGTAGAPLQTVKQLIAKLQAGQTGCLASGQTFGGFTLHAGDSHGAEGAPVTITSTNPSVPASINTRIATTSGADWLTFSHLTITSDVLSNNNEDPSPTVASVHTSWTYDDISGGDMNICILPSQPTEYGAAAYTLIEHDRIHDCGRPVTALEEEAQENDMYEGRLNGYHAHGVYDEGSHTTIKNNYFYDNSSKGILLRGGSYAVVEHNIVDHNGSGILFGDNGPTHDVVAWNIVSNSASPCGKETGWCDDFGVWSYCNESCVSDSFENNDLFGNANGNVAPSYDLCSCIEVKHNVEVNPLYVNAAAHEYTLQARSPAIGYGPDTAQPNAAAGVEPTHHELEQARRQAARATRRNPNATAARARKAHGKAKSTKHHHAKSRAHKHGSKASHKSHKS